MKVFQGSTFTPDTIALMTKALHDAVDTLPEQVSSVHVQALARTILDLAAEGERDPAQLKLRALEALRSTT